jgi:endonuclease/exonuclease/phosphatase (EEP) superfamily protein YafD
MSSTNSTANATLAAPTNEQQAEAAGLAAKVASLPHGPMVRHGWFWWLWHGIFWIIAIGLLIVAMLRVFYHDGTHLLIWINAFTRYVYLPAYACLAWSLWMRRWWLAAVSFAVVGFHVAWMVPDFVRDRRFDMPISDATANKSPKVRIFFANVLATNHDFSPLWKEIERSNADVVILAECSRFSNQSFKQWPAMSAYQHPDGKTKTHSGEVKVYSRLPVSFESQDWIAGRVIQSVDVEVGGQALRIVGIHAPRPQSPGYDYAGYYEKVVPLLSTEPGPVVVIGDFNATQYSLVYKELKQGGLRSAHDDRGRGYATTWPNGRWPVPPIRIDQAFLSRDIECLNISEGMGEGSDHKPLIVDVALRNPPQPSQTEH